MKKLLFFAVSALLVAGATSCKPGSCACVGTTDGVNTDIQDYSSVSGMSSSMVCAEIKAKYPSAKGIVCREDKTVDEVKEELRN